jgi:hypothetical protein
MSTPTQTNLQLRDIHLPGPPDFWPPAPGWWVLAALVSGLAAWAGVLLWRQFKIHRQRREILALLEQMENATESTATPEFLARLSRLIRRLALMRFPRQEIASLTGHDWLRFLDSSGGNGQFSRGPGRVLAQGPYMRTLPEPVDGRALTRLVRHWIQRNTGGR